MKKTTRIVSYFLILTLILFFIFKLPVQAGETTLWKSAAQNYYQGNYNEAKEILADYADEEIITAENFKAIEYLIKSEIKLINLQEAEKLLLKLEESGYQLAELYWLLGRKYLNREGHFDNAMFSEARDKLEKSRELGLFGIEQMRDLGQAYAGLEMYESSITLLEKVRENDPRPGDLSVLARSYHKTEQLQKAIDIYERLIVLKSDDAGIHLTLGNIYREIEEPQEAIEVYRQGLNSNPDHIGLRRALAVTEFQQQNFEEAEILLLEIAESHPHLYEIYYYLGQIYEEDDDAEKAQEMYEKAINYNSQYIRGYLALGKLFLHENNHYRAISQFSNAIDINPGFAEGYYLLGKTFYSLEMYEAALTEISNAIKRDPGHKNARELRKDLFEILEQEQIEDALNN